MVRRFLAVALLTVEFLAPAALRADIAIRPVTSDFDAEFARAADLLEKGDRAEGESVLLEIRRRANQRAWDARVALLLASDDERRKDFASAERRLRAAEAEAIGLEPYRRDRLGRVLEKAGRLADAATEWRLAFESGGAFRAQDTGRARAGPRARENGSPARSPRRSRPGGDGRSGERARRDRARSDPARLPAEECAVGFVRRANAPTSRADDRRGEGDARGRARRPPCRGAPAFRGRPRPARSRARRGRRLEARIEAPLGAARRLAARRPPGEPARSRPRAEGHGKSGSRAGGGGARSTRLRRSGSTRTFSART